MSAATSSSSSVSLQPSVLALPSTLDDAILVDEEILIDRLARQYLQSYLQNFPDQQSRKIEFYNIRKSTTSPSPPRKLHIFIYPSLEIHVYRKLPNEHDEELDGSNKRFSKAWCLTYQANEKKQATFVRKIKVARLVGKIPDRECNLRREVGLLEMFKGRPDICHLLDSACYDGMINRKAVTDKVVMYQELYDTDLHEYLHKLVKIPKDEKAKIVGNLTRCLLRGMAAIHDRNIIHCDMKPANCFIINEQKAVIGDFDHATGVTRKFKGTPAYLSPEIIERRYYPPFEHDKPIVYTSAVDMWSLGYILHALNSETCMPPRWHHLIGALSDLADIPARLAFKSTIRPERLITLNQQIAALINQIGAAINSLHIDPIVDLNDPNDALDWELNEKLNYSAESLNKLLRENCQKTEKETIFQPQLAKLDECKSSLQTMLREVWRRIQERPCPEDFMQALIWKMLRIKPEERITAQQALADFERHFYPEEAPFVPMESPPPAPIIFSAAQLPALLSSRKLTKIPANLHPFNPFAIQYFFSPKRTQNRLYT